MLRHLLFILVLVGLTDCGLDKPKPAKSQLQVRQFQTRSYSDKDTRVVMKAVINALQDEGYMIRNADKELGFISASKESDVENRRESIIARIFSGSDARYSKNSIMEASANISEFGKETRVRVLFQTKILDNFNNPVVITQIEDEQFYQQFFAKVDKSLFFERSKL